MGDVGSRIGIIGGGNIGFAMIQGFLKTGTEKRMLRASDANAERTHRIFQAFDVEATVDNRQLVEWADIVIIAVKPQISDLIFREIHAQIRSKFVIYLCAGIPLQSARKKLGHTKRLVRAMPNIPVMVAAGATILTAMPDLPEVDRQLAQALFEKIGRVYWMEEEQLDAVTGLSGSGPAYIFLIVEALADAGVKIGLSREAALSLSVQTMFGSAKMLIETNEHPGRLKDMVTSPGGTSIAGLHALENGHLRTTISDAVEAATKRSRELGQSQA